MREQIYSISDLELGQKDHMDDFQNDSEVNKFLEILIEESEITPTTLILNGDTFDYLKMPYLNKYPRYITEKISLWKTEKIFNSYPNFFQKLKEFSSFPRNKLYFIYGNHDFDLLWPKVQEKIYYKIANSHSKIYFTHYFNNKLIHIEHGNQQDTFFKIKTDNPFLKINNEMILNLPFGCYAITQCLIKSKQKYPHAETIAPRKIAFKAYPEFHKSIKQIFFRHALLEIFIKSFYKTDPTYRLPYLDILKQILRFGFNITNEEKFIEHRFKQLIKQHPHNIAIAYGHVHLNFSSKINNRICLITDTWRQEYTIDQSSNKTNLILKPRTFLKAIIFKNQLQYIGLEKFNENNE